MLLQDEHDDAHSLAIPVRCYRVLRFSCLVCSSSVVHIHPQLPHQVSVMLLVQISSYAHADFVLLQYKSSLNSQVENSNAVAVAGIVDFV